MDRTDCAIVINTCPKFFYILEGCIGLLKRYMGTLAWPLYLATEVPDDPVVQRLVHRFQIQLLKLDPKDADFLESRSAAVNLLPSTVKYVLPLQEDFLLERPGPDFKALENALEILDVDQNVKSIRLMPCPGSSAREGHWGVWKMLLPHDMTFSYQATIWRRELYTEFFESLVQQGRNMYPDLSGADWNYYAVRVNPAETAPGLFLMKALAPGGVHLCWPRAGSWPNAVYLCPWPYRPTAIVQGVLQPWAEELIRREGFVVHAPTKAS
jgi:hypothetical protein